MVEQFETHLGLFVPAAGAAAGLVHHALDLLQVGEHQFRVHGLDVAQGVAHDVLAFKAFYGCTEQLQRIEQLGLFGDDDLADREVLLPGLVAQVLEDMGLSAAEVGRHEHAARLLVAGDASAKILQPLAEDAQHILGRTAERAHGVTVGDARAQRLDGAPSGDLCIHLVPPDAVEILTMGA